MKTYFRILACLVLAFLSLSGVQSASAEKGNVLVLALDARDLQTLDPHMSVGFMDRYVVDMIYNGLLRCQPGDMKKIEPDLAKSYEISTDGKTWTFHLRKGVYFHPFRGQPNGHEMTSEDVVFSLKRAQNKETCAGAGSMQFYEVTAIDKYTVQINMTKIVPEPDRHFINYPPGSGFIVSKRAVKTLGGEFKNQPVGTGPFMFEKYRPGEKLTLKAHTKYFRGTPKLGGIEVRYMPDVNSRIFGLESGELHVVEGVREEVWVKRAEKVKNAVVDVIGPGEPMYIFFNISKPPLDDIRIRQAIAYGINRDTLVKFLGSSVAKSTCSPIPPFLSSGMTCEEVAKLGLDYAYNPEKAKSLLQEAGKQKGLEVLMFVSEHAAYLNPMTNLKEQLRNIGVDVKFNVVDHATWHKMIRSDASQIVPYSPLRPGPDVYFTQFYHSSSTVVSGKSPITNFSHYKGIDEKIERARSSVKRENTIMNWREAQIQILKDAVSLPLYIQDFVWARSKSVDWGHPLKWTLALYPQVTENTTIK